MGANNSKNDATEAKKNVPVEHEKRVDDAVTEEDAEHEDAARGTSSISACTGEVGKSAVVNKSTTKDLADVPSNPLMTLEPKNKRDSTPTKKNVIYSCKANASLRRSSVLNGFDKNVKVKLERSDKLQTKFVWNPFSRLHNLLEKSRPVVCSLSEVKRESLSNLPIKECVPAQCNPTVKIKKEKLEAELPITAEDNRETFSTEGERHPSVEESDLFFETLSSEKETPAIKTEILYSEDESEIYFESLATEIGALPLKVERQSSKEQNDITIETVTLSRATSSDIQEHLSEKESEISFATSPLKNTTISTEIVSYVKANNVNFEPLTTRSTHYKKAHASRNGKNKEAHASRKGKKASAEVRACKYKRMRQVLIDKFFNKTQNKTASRRKRRTVDKACYYKKRQYSSLKQTEIITRSKNAQLCKRQINTRQRGYYSREIVPKPLKLEINEFDAPNRRVSAIATSLPKPILVKCEAGVQRDEQHIGIEPINLNTQNEILTRSKNAQLCIRQINTRQRSYCLREIFPKPLKLEIQESDAPNLRVSEIAMTLPKPISVKCEAGVQQDGKHIKIEPKNLYTRLQPKVLLKRLHMPKLLAFKGRDLIAAAEETTSKLVNPPVLEIKLEILKEQEFLETNNVRPKYRHARIVKQEREQDGMPPTPPCKKRKLNSCSSLSTSTQLTHMPNKLNPIVRIKRLKLENAKEQAFSETANLKPSGKKRSFGSCLSISPELQIRNAYSLNPYVRIKRLKLESNLDLSIHTEHNANENTMNINSEPADNAATTTNFKIDSVASGYDAHMLMSPALKQEPPWECDDSGISMDFQPNCSFDFPAEESQQVQNDEPDDTLIRRIAMERARTNGLLLFYGCSPMQFKLFNTIEDLRVFLDYLLVK